MPKMHFSPRPNRAAEIRWREWGQAPFDEARLYDKPVLLGISAVWCHWCHVMDETTYSSPAIIDIVNERYIPVRVDNDQRPDVNARYNMGGWPTTAILTPEGEVLKGGTYIPPDAMQPLLVQIADFYANPDSRREIAKRISEVKSARAALPLTPEPATPDEDTAATVERVLASQFDEEYGGFGEEPKFPQTAALHFLLDVCAREPHERARNMVQKTLHAMAGGGMYDRVHGGFFRYSTTRDFSVPHFEKMLEDLGALLYACARAARLFGDNRLREVAIDVKRYLDEHLWNERFGGYGGSQDADEEYYKLDAAGRARLSEPYVDPIIYTSWNAQAACALLRAQGLIFEPDDSQGSAISWVERGLSILEMLWSRSMDAGLFCRYYDGQAHVRGLLGDQAWCAWAALQAFSVTGNDLWLDRISNLLSEMQSLYDARSGAYRDRLAGAVEAGRVADPSIPIEENALMARVLLAHAAFCGRDDLSKRAHDILGRYSRAYRPLQAFAAAYASAVLDLLRPPFDVKIVGDWKSPERGALRREALAPAAPPFRVDTLDPSRDSARIRALGYIAGAAPAVYLCSANECFARARNADELRSEIAALRPGPRELPVHKTPVI